MSERKIKKPKTLGTLLQEHLYILARVSYKYDLSLE